MHPQPESPCIHICSLNAEEVCTGCQRTIQEIIDWPTLNDIEKSAILNRLKKLSQATDSE